MTLDARSAFAELIAHAFPGSSIAVPDDFMVSADVREAIGELATTSAAWI
jgi:hypothetical protein